MNHRSHARLTAWLGLIAMWLIVCVPIVSQLVAAAQRNEPVAIECSAAESHGPALHGDHARAPSFAACGYCDLLATHGAMPSVPPAAPTQTVTIAFAAAPVLSTSFTPLGAFPSGRPRAPPVVS